MFTLFQSYEKDALACSEHVWLEVPVLCARMEAHLQDLQDKHKDDAELLRCIPFPASDHAEHPLVTNMEKMREGKRDFDVFCTLWSRSGYEQTHGPRRKKDSRLFILPSASNAFDISFFPRLVQDAYGKVTTAMHEVTAERKRAEAEAAKLAKIEELKQTAIAAAKKKLEEDKQLAEASVIATVACDIAMAGDANREATDEDNAAAKKAVSKFCSCSSSSFFFFFFRFAFSHCNAVCADGREKKRTDC